MTSAAAIDKELAKWIDSLPLFLPEEADYDILDILSVGHEYT
jgi:hypothetical protein